MKLYAIRDKRTGELRTAPGTSLLFVSKNIFKISMRRADVWELVRFREEPLEPCVWCKPADYKVFEPDAKFCQYCGRSLT